MDSIELNEGTEWNRRKGRERKGKERMSASAIFERTVAHAYININYGAPHFAPPHQKCLTHVHVKLCSLLLKPHDYFIFVTHCEAETPPCLSYSANSSSKRHRKCLGSNKFSTTGMACGGFPLWPKKKWLPAQQQQIMRGVYLKKKFPDKFKSQHTEGVGDMNKTTA